jgi:tetratricopeptide (TPR) repeat protein
LPIDTSKKKPAQTPLSAQLKGNHDKQIVNVDKPQAKENLKQKKFVEGKNGVKDNGQSTILDLLFKLMITASIPLLIGFLIIMIRITFKWVLSLTKEMGEKSTKNELSDLKSQVVLIKDFDKLSDKLEDFKNSFMSSTGLPVDYSSKGKRELERGNHKLAEAYYKLETLINKENMNGWEGLVMVYRLSGKSDEAVESIDEAISLHPNIPLFKREEILKTKGKILMDSEKYEKAKNTMKDILKLNPSNKDAKDDLDKCIKILTKEIPQRRGK